MSKFSLCDLKWVVQDYIANNAEGWTEMPSPLTPRSKIHFTNLQVGKLKPLWPKNSWCFCQESFIEIHMLIGLLIVYSYCHATTAEFSSFNRGCVAHKAKNTSYLAPFRGHLLTTALVSGTCIYSLVLK